MPEGDTVFRAARALDRALAGRIVTRFESVFAHLTRVDADRPLRGRTIGRVDSRGTHLAIWFSGDLVLHRYGTAGQFSRLIGGSFDQGATKMQPGSGKSVSAFESRPG